MFADRCQIKVRMEHPVIDKVLVNYNVASHSDLVSPEIASLEENVSDRQQIKEIIAT